MRVEERHRQRPRNIIKQEQKRNQVCVGVPTPKLWSCLTKHPLLLSEQTTPVRPPGEEDNSRIGAGIFGNNSNLEASKATPARNHVAISGPWAFVLTGKWREKAEAGKDSDRLMGTGRRRVGVPAMARVSCSWAALAASEMPRRRTMASCRGLGWPGRPAWWAGEAPAGLLLLLPPLPPPACADLPAVG